MSAGQLFADHALLPDGWAHDVLLAWDDAGALTSVVAGTPAPADTPRANGPLLPGMPNLHSHAFQRAFAGLSEYRGANRDDSFWTWRDLMYRFALRISPDQLEAIATQLYTRDAACRLHRRVRVPLPPPRARRPALRRPGRDGDAPDRRRAARRHRPHAAAGAVPGRGLRRPAPTRRSTPLRQQRRFAASHRTAHPRARRPRRHRAALAARGRPAGAARGAGPAERDRRDRAGPHPHRRAAAGGRRLPGLVRPTTGRVAAREHAGRCALVPGARDPSERHGTPRTRCERFGRRPVPDDRGEPRRRHLPCRRLPGRRRRLGHRLRQPHQRRRRRGASPARVHAAPCAAAPQRAGRREPGARWPITSGSVPSPAGRRRVAERSAGSASGSRPTSSCSMAAARSPALRRRRRSRAMCSRIKAAARCATCSSPASGVFTMANTRCKA